MPNRRRGYEGLFARHRASVRQSLRNLRRYLTDKLTLHGATPEAIDEAVLAMFESFFRMTGHSRPRYLFDFPPKHRRRKNTLPRVLHLFLGRAFGAVSSIESNASAIVPAAACGETPKGGTRRAISRACGSARSFFQRCTSHSRIAPASISTEIAHLSSIRLAGFDFFVTSI
jgi:hypothetical protein